MWRSTVLNALQGRRGASLLSEFKGGAAPAERGLPRLLGRAQEYLKDHRMMAEILAELQGQLVSLLGDGAPAEAETPALLKRAQEKV